jgi:hypothetical protein
VSKAAEIAMAHEGLIDGGDVSTITTPWVIQFLSARPG